MLHYCGERDEGPQQRTDGGAEMILTQDQADQLIAALKEALQAKTFIWAENRRDDEEFKTAAGDDIRFILTLKRNPFEIKLHLRTRDRHVGLVRLD
jgi:hypothetical protein